MWDWRLGVLKFEMSLKMEEGGGLKGEGEGQGSSSPSMAALNLILRNFFFEFEGFLVFQVGIA